MRICNPCWMSDCQSHTHQMSLSFLEQHLWRHYNCRLECQTVRLQDQSQNQDYLGLHWSWDGSRNINITGHHWLVQYHTVLFIFPVTKLTALWPIPCKIYCLWQVHLYEQHNNHVQYMTVRNLTCGFLLIFQSLHLPCRILCCPSMHVQKTVCHELQ